MQQYEKLPSEAANRQQKAQNKRGYVMAKATSQKIGRYDVSVTKKRIKNLYLRVSPQGDRISVNAPLRISDEEIVRFVLSREEWIEQQLSKQTGHRPRAYEEGEELPYFGRRLSLRLRYRNGGAKAERKGETLELTIRQDADAPPGPSPSPYRVAGHRFQEAACRGGASKGRPARLPQRSRPML